MKKRQQTAEQTEQERVEHVHLLVSPFEKNWLLKAAKGNGLTVSGMVRKWIRQEAVGRY